MSDVAPFRDQLAHRIAATPLERGFCVSVITDHPEHGGRATPCASVFPSTLALAALQAAAHPATLRTQQRITEALWTQQNAHGSWNYWQRGSADSKRQPYPDDLDTTACALAALGAIDPNRMTGDLLANITMHLIATEAATGGPYRTWLVPPTADAAWKDVDPLVNANVGRFLHGQGVQLPALTRYLTEALERGQAQSPYYLSPLATYYFLSSWWPGSQAAAAVKDLHTRQRKNGSWGTPLETAWAVTTLLRWEGRTPATTRGMDWLMARPLKALARPYALCVNSIQGDQKTYLGSTHLTLATCLEAASVWDALGEYSANDSRSSREKALLKGAKTVAYEHAHGLQNTLPKRPPAFDQIAARIAALPHPLRSLAQEQLNTFEQSKEGRQIAHLPALFADTLPAHIRKRIPDTLLTRLGAINLYGWIAYTIYDDVLDHEADIRQLPVANFCLRELTMQYAMLGKKSPQALPLFNRVLDGIDAANTWEVLSWRLQQTAPGIWHISHPLPDAEGGRRLAQRSLGHALGPLTLLTFAGRGPHHVHFQSLEAFFTHYLIARQMDDDAHDWEDDLARGQINSVSADLLSTWIPKRPKPSVARTDFPALRQLFWEERVEPLYERILNHLKRAEMHLNALPFIQNRAPLLALLAPIRASAQRARVERKKTLAFLNTYASKQQQKKSGNSQSSRPHL
jgi:hypothetical protein